ncbi:MAG: peptidoglycan DD-metalloendopeptidase family protein [Endomicrobium sp.]|jgi:murein DD-endopeptidase MepM/ murein hydrolase activator NlpD|nr:peptidoglycan DD-metalloendopeptidase family protein [Endomicrobium sp.]
MKKILRKTIFFAALSILLSALVFGFVYWKISKLEYVPIPAEYDIDIEKVTISEGDVFVLTLEKTKLSKEHAVEISAELKKHMNIGRVIPGDFYEVVYSTAGEWTHFWHYPSKSSDFYSLKRFPDGSIVSGKKTLPSSFQTIKSSGTIESSLWESMSAAGVPAAIIVDFADIFAWQMDFLTDTRKGDEFKIVYRIGTLVKTNVRTEAQILAAEYKTASKTYDAFYYKAKDGYFDKDGKSVKSAFLKAPLQFRRISSHFTTRRFHPVLKYVRAHLGIDYAAPSGTPISSIGDGTVVKSQRNGGFGHYVEIKHSNGYASCYGHLSKYGRGIRRGARVRQGQIIGYVGSTGVSTGPHLDFRIKKNGKFFNYLTMKQPPVTTLSANDKKEFKAQIQEYENGW